MVVVVVKIKEGFGILSLVPRDGGDIVEISQVLYAEGQVEAHLLADGLLGLEVAALAHHHTGRVGGQHGEQKEHQCHHTEHQQQAITDFFNNISNHGGKGT